MPVAHSMQIPSGHPTTNVVHALKAVWVDYRREAVARHEAQAAIRELSRLDDAALADMGINRGQIENVVLRGKR
jgi:uncharacterized protein YjiS (DUF1127 family)